MPESKFLKSLKHVLFQWFLPLAQMDVSSVEKVMYCLRNVSDARLKLRCWKKVLVCLFLYLFIQDLMVKTWQEVRTERDGESGTTWNKNPWLDSKPQRMKHIYNHFLHNEPWLQLLLLGIVGSINIFPSHVFTCMYFKYAAVKHSLSSLAHTLRGGVANRGDRGHL